MANNRVAIVGAGIMGRVLAWQLQRAGFVLTLFDRDAIDGGQGAAHTAAGMLTPYCEVESAECLIYQLGVQSLQLWPLLCEQLAGDCGWQQRGSLVVAHRQDHANLTQFNRQLQAKLAVTADKLQQLNQQQLQTLEPALAEQFHTATYLPQEASLCPQKTLAALAQSLLNAGVCWHANTQITQVAAHRVVTHQHSYHFDWVIDCRGLGAKPQWPALRGVRGELIWLQAPEVSLTRLVRLMHPRYRLYLVPKGYDDLYIIGATQIESADQGPITVRSSLELLSAAYSLHRGFAEARIVDMRTNCRPALSDNLPKVAVDTGLIRINGLFRHGFLLAPIIAQEVCCYLQEADYHCPFTPLFQQAAAYDTADD
ncbi:MAG: glycine oxidase ThiO [Cellvibrionaceae bacterium]|nr:glycine oxidase ThiO [Cellvibrionaceae bacterium]